MWFSMVCTLVGNNTHHHSDQKFGMLLIPGTGNGERGTGNRERESGNECTAVTHLIIQNGGRRKRRKEVSRL